MPQNRLKGLQRFFCCLVVSALACLIGGPAFAQLADCSKPYSAWNVQWENDSFPGASRGGSDRFYTNGIRISRTRNGEGIAFLAGLLDKGWFSGDGGGRGHFCSRSGFRIGHQFYTPQTIAEAELDIDDRPYAGLLYGSFSLAKASVRLDDNEPGVIRTADLQLGIVGPAAGARRLQSEWHRLPFIEAKTPQGWRNQLPNEPVLNLNLTAALRHPLGSWFDIVPQVGVGIGNVFTGARARATLRFGQNLQKFPYQRIEPSMNLASFDRASLAVEPANSPGRSWWLFAAVEGEAVAHDIFLDGTLFRDSHRVDTKRFRTVLSAGLHFELKDYGINLMWVTHSKEFETQRVGVDKHEYLSISVERLPRFGR